MADAGSPLERMSSQDRRVTIIAAQLDELEAEIAGLELEAAREARLRRISELQRKVDGVAEGSAMDQLPDRTEERRALRQRCTAMSSQLAAAGAAAGAQAMALPPPPRLFDELLSDNYDVLKHIFVEALLPSRAECERELVRAEQEELSCTRLDRSIRCQAAALRLVCRAWCDTLGKPTEQHGMRWHALQLERKMARQLLSRTLGPLPPSVARASAAANIWAVLLTRTMQPAAQDTRTTFVPTGPRAVALPPIFAQYDLAEETASAGGGPSALRIKLLEGDKHLWAAVHLLPEAERKLARVRSEQWERLLALAEELLPPTPGAAVGASSRVMAWQAYVQLEEAMLVARQLRRITSACAERERRVRDSATDRQRQRERMLTQVREAKAEIAAVGTEVSAAREQLLEAALTVFAADVQLTEADGASGAIAVARTAQAHAAAQCEQLSALPALNFVGGGESYGAGEARVLRRMLHFQLQSVRASVDDFDAEIESLEPEPEPEPEARKRR